VLQSHLFEGLINLLADLEAFFALNLQGKSDVFENCAVVEKLEILENNSEVTPKKGKSAGGKTCQILPVDQNLSATRFFLAEKKFEKRRFACPRRSSDVNKLSFGDSQSEIGKRRGLPVECLGDVKELNHNLPFTARLIIETRPLAAAVHFTNWFGKNIFFDLRLRWERLPGFGRSAISLVCMILARSTGRISEACVGITIRVMFNAIRVNPFCGAM